MRTSINLLRERQTFPAIDLQIIVIKAIIYLKTFRVLILVISSSLHQSYSPGHK